MKSLHYIFLVIASLALAACTSIDDLKPMQSGTHTAAQVKEANTVAPTRANASFNAMFTTIGKPGIFYGVEERSDDFGILTSLLSADAESADLIFPDNDYNWFSTCGEYSSRTPSYANPMMRYGNPYNEIANANNVLLAYPAGTTDKTAINNMAQAHAIRAYSYMMLAPFFQRNYQIAPDEPCVPIVTEETTDFTNNPRATVKAVYDLIISDLNYAVENLEGYTRSSKSLIDQQVAYGLRARAYLTMGKWQEAYDDAVKAAAGYTPASIEEVSKPSFFDISEHNWIWGYDMTLDLAKSDPYNTMSAWLRSFSGDGYSPACQAYALINQLLYDQINSTDVRKGWWVDAALTSPLLKEISWNGATGDAISSLKIENVKEPFLPYTNVKFGMYTYGGTTNEEDFPLMRVEEMILIQAECLANLGKEADARTLLNDFVKTYRDPNYNAATSPRTLLNEIWFQRRVELWGEGFGMPDVFRLNKPVVRFTDTKPGNWPDNFRFNIAADDGWLQMRFPQGEMNTNFGIVDNTDGVMPVKGQNATLRDGVTD